MNNNIASKRNKTLKVNREEIPILQKFISNIEDLKEGLKKEMIINADLYDCLDHIPNEYFDLIIIDPPYNIDKDFNGFKFSSMNRAQYEDYLRSWFYKVSDKLKKDGSLYMCGDWKSTAAMQNVIEDKLTIINRISWQRDKGRGAKYNWKNGMEDIWFAVKDPNNYHFNVEAVKVRRKVIAPYRLKGQPKDWDETNEGNFRTTYPSNFWDDITIPFWSMPENTNHPTQKPEKLFAKLILASTKVGDKVFDPFLGSGTSAVVAKKFNRDFCGIEINREYCLWAAKRLLNKVDTIQGYIDGVFWERNSQREQSKHKNSLTDSNGSQKTLFDL